LICLHAVAALPLRFSQDLVPGRANVRGGLALAAFGRSTPFSRHPKQEWTVMSALNLALRLGLGLPGPLQFGGGGGGGGGGGAPDMAIAITSFVASTGGGNQTVTTSDLGGRIPNGVYLVATSAVANNTYTSQSRLSQGATDGTNHWCAGSAKHGATSPTRRRGTTDSVLMVLDVAGNTLAEAALVEFVENGIVLNWLVTPAAGYQVAAYFFAGADLPVKVGVFTGDASGAAVATPFEPRFIIFGGHNGLLDDVSDSAAANQFIGFCAKYGNYLMQRSVGAASPAGGDAYSDVYNYAAVQSLEPNPTYTVSVTGITDAGFSHKATNSYAESDQFGYIAVGAPKGISVWLGVENMPTSTGNFSFTGVPFQPDTVLFAHNRNVSTRNYFIGFGGFDASNFVTRHTAHQDGLGGAGSAASNDGYLSANVSTSLAERASFVSFNSDGWTWNVTTAFVNYSTVVSLAIAFEPEAPPPDTVTVGAMKSYGIYKTREHAVIVGAMKAYAIYKEV
jgi:hypothetical protein